MENKSTAADSGDVIIIEAASLKLSDFLDLIIKNAEPEDKKNEWFSVLSNLDGKIHAMKMAENVTFADDRVVQIAYQIMCKTNIFDAIAGKNEWWIVKRYFDIYLPESLELKEDLKKFTVMYIGFAFSQEEQTSEQKNEMSGLVLKLSNQIFNEDYIIPLPRFFLDAVESGENVAKPSESSVYFKTEREQWEGVKNIAEIMLSKSEIKNLKNEEVLLWKNLLKQSIKNLK